MARIVTYTCDRCGMELTEVTYLNTALTIVHSKGNLVFCAECEEALHGLICERKDED